MSEPKTVPDQAELEGSSPPVSDAALEKGEPSSSDKAPPRNLKLYRGLPVIPQPTNDPNDPLNWPMPRKYATYLTVCFFSVMATVNSSNFTIAIGPISKEFHETTTRTGYLVCFNVLLLGLGNAVWMPVMRVFGRRPVYLLGLLLLMVFNVWSYKAKSYSSLLAARILSGFAASSADATVPALVADLFYTHERGHMMMIFHMALAIGYFLGPLVCAYVTQAGGWRWTCGMLAIAAGVTFLVGIFTIRETSHPARWATTLHAKRRAGVAEHEALGADADAPPPPPHSAVQWLSLSLGYNKDESFVRTFFRVFSMAAYPPITWTGLTVGTFVGWNIAVQLTSSVTLTKPPYHFSTGDLGLLNISGFLGAVISFFLGGKLIDIIATRMTVANGGRREPEFRLPAIVIPAVIGPMGVLIFGLCIAHKTTWVGAAFGFGMQGFGLTAVANVVVTYAVDGYRDFAGEALCLVFFIRNLIACMLALYTNDWRIAAGVANAFGQMVAIEYFFLLMAIPFYFYGRRIRAWTHTFGPVKALSNEMEA